MSFKSLKSQWPNPLHGELVSTRIGNIHYSIQLSDRVKIFPEVIHVRFARDSSYVGWSFLDDNGFCCLTASREQKNLELILETTDSRQVYIRYLRIQECLQLYVLRESLEISGTIFRRFTRHDLNG